MHSTLHWLKCLHPRVTHIHANHGERLIVASVLRFWLSPCVSPSPCSSLPTSTCTWPELLLPWGQRQGNFPCALRQLRSLAPWRYTILPQVMSPTSLTSSTTRRLLKWSSRRNPATKIRSPRTCVTRNSTMRPSGKRYRHHCSFRSEENQRTEDKLITLVKKVCLPAQSFFTHTQERRDLCTNIVRAEKNQVAKWKTKQSGFSLKYKKSKSRWFQSRDSETWISSRFWWEKYPGLKGINYRVSKRRNLSCSSRRRTNSTRFVWNKYVVM